MNLGSIPKKGPPCRNRRCSRQRLRAKGSVLNTNRLQLLRQPQALLWTCRCVLFLTFWKVPPGPSFGELCCNRFKSKAQGLKLMVFPLVFLQTKPKKGANSQNRHPNEDLPRWDLNPKETPQISRYVRIENLEIPPTTVFRFPKPT